MDAPREFMTWAPEESAWARWAKPTLFAHWYSHPSATIELPTIDVARFAPVDGSRAMVVDAPAAAAVAIGVALARIGYRPVPLFNGCPGPFALIEVAPLMAALRAGADVLAGLTVAPNAPPVFLLDCGRLDGLTMPGRFDNRWVTTPQDFPSANRLRADGITTVLVWRTRQHDDLDQVLAGWQDGGLSLLAVASVPWQPLTVARRRWFGSWFARVRVMSGLRRSSAGGFGGVIPVPSQGGG